MTDLEFKKIIAELARIKKTKGLSQVQIANIAGTAQSTISDWFLGRKPFNTKTKQGFDKVVRFFKLDYLIDDSCELIDLPVSQPEPTKTPIFKAKPKTTITDFVRCDNGSIVEIQSGKVFTESQFNELFEAVA